MNKYLLNHLGKLPLYVLLQVFILNEILFSGYINPFLYIVLIISLPSKTPKWFLLIYAFLLGASIDIFSGSLGFHSTATILIAFIKPFIQKITIPHNILGETDRISFKKVGAKAFITFSLLLIFAHNTCLFIIEDLSISLNLFGKILASSLMTLIIILIAQLLQKEK